MQIIGLWGGKTFISKISLNVKENKKKVIFEVKMKIW
jgi:hypothetical protein